MDFSSCKKFDANDEFEIARKKYVDKYKEYTELSDKCIDIMQNMMVEKSESEEREDEETMGKYETTMQEHIAAYKELQDVYDKQLEEGKIGSEEDDKRNLMAIIEKKLRSNGKKVSDSLKNMMGGRMNII